MDSKGIITSTRGDKLPGHKSKVSREDDTPVLKDLVEAVRKVKPHALIGLTGRGPAFNKVLSLSQLQQDCRGCFNIQPPERVQASRYGIRGSNQLAEGKSSGKVFICFGIESP